MDIKENFHSKLQAIREEQLDELRQPKNIDSRKKHIKDTIKISKERAYDEYDKKHGEDVDARKNHLKNKTDKTRDKAAETDGARRKVASRARILQKLDKLEEEQLDELRGYQGRGQKLLAKVHARATKRLMGAVFKDPKTARRNQQV